jgi:hypothetical protein
MAQMMEMMQNFIPKDKREEANKLLDLDLPKFHEEYKKAFPEDGKTFLYLQSCYHQMRILGAQEDML